LKLPVELLRTGVNRVSKSGQTRNLSSSGVLIDTEARVTIGEPIEYLITLPVGRSGGEPVRLRCMGKVVRQQGLSSAATLERYEFLRG